MSNTIVYPFFQATLAQILGVTLALFGCVGVLRSTDRGDWSPLRWSGIGIPFLLAYAVFIFGLFCHNHRLENPTPMELETYMKFILLYLYADAILLPIMVGCSGGVKQSIFSPLFFAIPTMAVVFIPSFAKLHIYSITGVTLAGYIIVYLLPIDDKISGRLYRFCECVILVGSVVLSVLVSQQVSSLQ